MTAARSVLFSISVVALAGCQSAPEPPKEHGPEKSAKIITADDPGRVTPGGSSVSTRETRDGGLADRGQATADPESVGTFGEQANIVQHEHREDGSTPPAGQTKENPGKPPAPVGTVTVPAGAQSEATVVDGKPPAAKEPAAKQPVKAETKM